MESHSLTSNITNPTRICDKRTNGCSIHVIEIYKTIHHRLHDADETFYDHVIA